MGQQVWRWNSHIVWHYFSSAAFEAASAKEATNPFIGYHHLRACAYFAIACVEALLNDEMRKTLQHRGLSEDSILKFIRKPRLTEKCSKWPSEICDHPTSFEHEANVVLGTYKELRDEITHPKRSDHSIYVDLEQMNFTVLVNALARSIVAICDGKATPFPYWVLGWNYVGANGNAAFPILSNNLNGFAWSLMNMGIKARADETWENKSMKGLDAFVELKRILEQFPFDIEPWVPHFPFRPRLTRRWWDREFVYASSPHGTWPERTPI